MARGDVTFFNEALAYILEGGWEPTDTIKCAIVTNAVVPTASTASPALSDFTEVATGGTYTAGGTSLGDIQTCVTQSSNVVTFDSATNPSWASHASNGTNAYYAIVYNDTDASDKAMLFVDLGGPVDMQAGTLTITWNASGLFTITA